MINLFLCNWDRVCLYDIKENIVRKEIVVEYEVMKIFWFEIFNFILRFLFKNLEFERK